VKNFLTVLTAIALFGLVACEGPAGPAGKDGTAGATGATGQNAGFVYFEGFKADLKCAQCHNPNDVDTTYRVITKSTQYEMSGHKELGNYDRNTTTCAGCHTNEGFFERSLRGVANETFTLTAASGPLTNQAYTSSSPVGCFTCHAPHKRGDFSLRDTVGQVKIFSLVAGNTTKTFTGSTSAQLCVKCHQPRMTSHFLIPGTTPTSWQPNANAAATDTAKIYTSRWNNHVSGEGIQTMLGFGGVEFAGNTYSSSFHSTALQSKALDCADCHMATPVGNKGGGHTFKVGYIPEGSTTLSYNLLGCNTSACHGTSGAITTSGAKWKTVREEMRGKTVALAKMMMDSATVSKWTVLRSGKFVPWVTQSVSLAGDTSWAANAATATPLQIVPAVKAGALWNLQMAMYEASRGIHNTAYTRSLLDASIAELKKP